MNTILSHNLAKNVQHTIFLCSYYFFHDYNLSESPIDDFSFFTHNVQVFKLRYEFLILARVFSSVSPAICFSAVK